MKLADLQRALRAADPAAVLVAPSILERIIKQVYDLPGLQWSVPHIKCCVVDRRMLFRHAEQADLDLEPDQLLPSTVILLARPSAEDLTGIETPALLLKYWRRLFHASIHHHFETAPPNQSENGRNEFARDGIIGNIKPANPDACILTSEDIQRRIEEIGPAEFDEIRAVLIQDNYLPTNAGDREIYIEFAGVYLELRYFAANLLPNYFPGLRDATKIEQMLARDIDAADIFRRTRLPDAPDPVIASDTRSDETHEYYWKLLRTSDRAAQASNNVRSAILRTTASRVAPAALTKSTRDMAERDMASLAMRLQVALQMSEAETENWTEHLILLLDKADQGNQPVEARLLHDLQNVCIDHEREVYTLDLVEWVLSAGKKPIKRPLPSQRHVRIARHLRAANSRLGAVRLTEEERQQLGRLLASALKKAEEGMRARFGPVLTTALHDVGLAPSNPPERAAFNKMVEELLDRITTQGFLTFGDLRDTISRNQLKMPDLVEPQDFLRGDALLRLDRRLASLLDGVYRPGEFYMRWLERLTSLNFGTNLGRKITRWVTIPFGGAVLILKGAEVIAHYFQDEPTPATQTGLSIASSAAAGVSGIMPPAATPAGQLLSPATLLFYLLGVPALGFFLMALMHVSRFRAWWVRLGRNLGQTLHTALIDWPRRALPWTAITGVVQSWPFKVFSWYVLQPAVVTTALWFLLDDPFFHNWQNPTWVGATALFLCVNLILNSRLGQAATETIYHSILAFWSLLRAGLIIGLYRLIVQLSRRVLDGVETWLFRVDEWLRFRSGDTKASLVLRTILGVVWFPIAYVSRFTFVVLIEPALNPIKFVVASVAAKFMYPVMIALNVQEQMTAQLKPFLFSDWLTRALVIAFLTMFPDAFGFLFWEIKENWRLFRTNRRATLGPVPIGPHGETMRGLLQPGFHSGTVPRLFARLRMAEREAYKTSNWHAARFYRHELVEIERCLREFMARELVAMVGQSNSWEGLVVKVGRIELGINRVRFTLENASQPARPLELTVHLRGQWLVAAISQVGWLETLQPEQLRALTTSLSSLYKMADIDLVREQVDAFVNATFGRSTPWDPTREGLIVCRSDGAPLLRYDLHGELALTPRLLSSGPVADGPPPGPPLEPSELLFRRWRLTWERWVQAWEKDQAGQGHPGIGGPVLLPERLDGKVRGVLSEPEGVTPKKP